MEEEPKLRMKFISQLGSTVGISAKEKLTNHFGALLSEVPKKKGGLEGKALKKLLEELKAFDFQIETLIQKEKWEEALQLCIDLFEIFCPYLRFVKEEDLRLVNFLVALQKKITPVFNEALPITLGQDSFNYFKLLTSEKQKNNPHFKVGVLLFLATIAREENEIESVLEIFDDLKGYYRIVGVNIMQRKREFILEKKGKPAFLKYCLSHQDRDENQKAAILFLIDEKEFEQAEQIALQGQKRNQGYYYEADFSILLLKIYQLTNQNLKGITLAKSLFYLSSGRLEYFLFLKSFYDEKTWSEIRGKIILDLRKLRGGEIFSNLRKIYKVEEMWPELLEFFKKSVLLSELLSFTPKLMVSNAKETMTLWFKELKYSFNYFYYDSDRDKVASFLRGLKFRIAENEFEFLIQKLILEFSNRENIVAFLKASLLWKPEPEDSEKSDDDGLEFDEEEDDFDVDDDEAFFD